MKERCINHAQLLGRVGNDIKLKEYEDGKTRCFFNVATDETYNKQNQDGTGLYLTIFIYMHPQFVWVMLICLLITSCFFIYKSLL